MAEEQSQLRGQPSSVPSEYSWPSLLAKDGDELETHYRHTLEELGKYPGMLGLIFRKAQNKIQDPAKLRRLIVDLIDRELWSSISSDVKGGAGQYFTPRALIAAMVEVMAPKPGQTICDPACGTGGFLLAAHDYLANPKNYALDREQSKESLTINRDDFWATTSNKQLNFLQHIFTILRQHGRAAVVLPDNVLFEGGAGETIRRALLRQADVHTLLRLPTGIFYAQGVKANVLFFDRKPAREQPWTEKLWIYDLRTNKHFTLKERTLQRSDLDDFTACYNPKNRHQREESERFKSFTYEELTRRDKANLDIFWLKEESLEDTANMPEPGGLALEIMEDLEAALEQFATIAKELKNVQEL